MAVTAPALSVAARHNAEPAISSDGTVALVDCGSLKICQVTHRARRRLFPRIAYTSGRDQLDSTAKARCSRQSLIGGQERHGQRDREGNVEAVVEGDVAAQRPRGCSERARHLVAVIDERNAGMQQCPGIRCGQGTS